MSLHSENGFGGSRNLGTLTVHAEEAIASKSVVEMVFRCSNLDNKDLFSKSVCIQTTAYSEICNCRYLHVYLSLLTFSTSFAQSIIRTPF